MDDMQEMLEHYRITRLVSEYCHGCDRRDGPRMASVYAEDSFDDHGVTKMSGQGFSAQATARRLVNPGTMAHHLGQTLVKIDGDKAGAETYFTATISNIDEEGAPVLHQLGGRYVDELIREGGQWRIKKRLTIRDWSITHDVVKDWIATRELMPGQLDDSDPSFAALGIRHSGLPAPE